MPSIGSRPTRIRGSPRVRRPVRVPGRRALLAAGALLCGGTALAQGEGLPVDVLAERTHFHGIAVDRADPSRLYLATHHGLFVVSREGTAIRVSQGADDLMGFTPHPADPEVLYASGHPAGGGNLGFVVSTDGGKSWRQRAAGAQGPADFHQMAVSGADPEVIYGVHGGLQVSRDGGRSWRLVGRAPAGLIDLAASTLSVERLYAATQAGLQVSEDGGRSWRRSGPARAPATLVHTHGGRVYVFAIGQGLIRGEETGSEWTSLGTDLGERYLLHLALDPTDPDRLYAVTYHSRTREGGVVTSDDGGRSWKGLGADG